MVEKEKEEGGGSGGGSGGEREGGRGFPGPFSCVYAARDMSTCGIPCFSIGAPWRRLCHTQKVLCWHELVF